MTDDLTHYIQATGRMRVRAEKAEAEVERLREELAEARADLSTARGQDVP